MQHKKKTWNFLMRKSMTIDDNIVLDNQCLCYLYIIIIISIYHDVLFGVILSKFKKKKKLVSFYPRVAYINIIRTATVIVIENCHMMSRMVIRNCHIIPGMVIGSCHTIRRKVVDNCHNISWMVIVNCHIVRRKITRNCYVMSTEWSSKTVTLYAV